ncbi:MAG: lysophospholipid acyltransferase family protein [Desulfofustis sp.]|nr:lysophospholipid acyltransferase family protein [Desulfofustis sp.]
MKQVRHYIEYQLLMCIGFLIRNLSRQTILRLGRLVGDFIYYCVPVRRAVVVDHLEQAFPEKPRAEIKKIARGTYQNLGMNVIEHLRLPTLSPEEVGAIVDLADEEILVQALERKRGVIIVGGHFGNWEYSSSSLPAKGYRFSVVVAKVSNKYINDRINEHREATGGEMIPKRSSTKAVIRVLRKNGSVGMLIDQNLKRWGTFVDFFGRPCSTVRGPALLACKTGASIIFFASIRQPDGTIKVIFEPVEIDYQAGATEENIHNITQHCTSRLEHYVRLYPDQWFWMHRRWKTRPSEEISTEK